MSDDFVEHPGHFLEWKNCVETFLFLYQYRIFSNKFPGGDAIFQRGCLLELKFSV